MASACLNNVGRPTENFLDCSVSYGWLNPRISLSREIHDGEKTPKAAAGGAIAKETSVHSETDAPDLECSLQDIGEFEFRLEDPVTMLPADELFSDGKLVPLQLSFSRLSLPSNDTSEVRSRKTLESPRRTGVATADPFLFSPKAPRCSSRWKDLLGLKKFYQNSNAKTDKSAGTLSSPSPSPSQSTGNNGNGSKSRRIFLHRSSKSSVVAAIESSMNLPLLKDLDSESAGCMSSRLSLSSSSSGHEHDDIPRLSLDSEKPILSRNTANPGSSSSSSNPPPPKVRVMRQRASSSENAGSSRVVRSPTPRTPESSSASGVSVDSPRMNSSGKVVFQSLERSSSSPSTFNGGPRVKLRGMERSYSANLRVTPVLNVPVCSLSKSSVFGFPLFSLPQKREVAVGSPSIGGVVNNRSRGQQQHMISNRT